MKQLFETLKHRFVRRGSGGQPRAAGHNPWRDWYIVLGITSGILFALFAFAAYTFFLVGEKKSPDSSNGTEYNTPVTSDGVMTVLQTLRTRTEKFEQLRKTETESPDPGSYHDAPQQDAVPTEEQSGT